MCSQIIAEFALGQKVLEKCADQRARLPPRLEWYGCKRYSVRSVKPCSLVLECQHVAIENGTDPFVAAKNLESVGAQRVQNTLRATLTPSTE